MTWLSWRQFRGQALVAAAALTAVAIALLVTGPGLAHYYSTMVETCQSRGDCDVVASVLGEKHELLQLLSIGAGHRAGPRGDVLGSSTGGP